MADQTDDPIVQQSRDIIRKGSKSFSAAATLFDKDARSSAYMLYAWCRYCDDEIDGQELGHSRNQPAASSQQLRLTKLYAQTQKALVAQTETPVFVGLGRVVNKHEIPHRYPFELLEGFAMDADEAEYRDLDDTLRYCYHVAGVVGVMMAHVMGVRESETLNRASDLGIAFQLTNIARDVIEDAEVGRVYLPTRWLEEAGIPPQTLHATVHRDALCNVVRRLLDEAERYYASANQGLAALDFRCAWAIATARGVYREIGKVVLERGPAAWDQRAVVGKIRKLYWVLRGGIQAMLRRRARTAPRDALWTKPEGAQTPRLNALTSEAPSVHA
jgi:phytoene synthase